jgi:hypothetical protein
MFDRLRAAIASQLRHSIREHHTVRGFKVVVENTRPDIATNDVLARLDEALGLIETYQPWRLAHLRRDFREFWIVRYPCRGAYYPVERACVTELTFLGRRDITAATVASSIVHEGMHARVAQMGVSPENRDIAREERLCRRAELEFGESLPLEIGPPVVERARASLLLEDEAVAPVIDWQIANQRIGEADRAALKSAPNP